MTSYLHRVSIPARAGKNIRLAKIIVRGPIRRSLSKFEMTIFDTRFYLWEVSLDKSLLYASENDHDYDLIYNFSIIKLGIVFLFMLSLSRSI
jgi:hypothetical protein